MNFIRFKIGALLILMAIYGAVMAIGAFTGVTPDWYSGPNILFMAIAIIIVARKETDK